jgi:DHA2 family multidrug resistance protein
MSGATTAAPAPTAAENEASDRAWRPKANPWLIAVVVTLAAFMEILDTTIVNVSLPHIAGTVAASYDEATWVLTSYLVANGIVLPISGFLGRLIGRKRYFLICIAMFTVCSFLCGMSNNLGELVIFRLLQGFFGGGLQPNQQSIILDTFEPAQRGRAFSVVAIAVIVAPIIGPTLGGWITDTYSWRWIFLINIPVGVLAFFSVAALVEDPPWVLRNQGGKQHVDYIGLMLIALGLGCLQIMLDRGEDNDWFTSSFIQFFAVLAAVGISGAVVWLSTTKKPIVNLRVFLDRNFAVGSVMIFGFGAILYSSAVLLPQLAQEKLGYTATWAGLILSPGGFIIIALIPLVGKLLLPYVQTRLIIAFGFFSLGCALLYAQRVTPDIDFETLALMRAAQTFGLAFLFVPTSTITYSTLPRELNGDGSALYVMIRNVAGSIGISLSTAMITTQSQAEQARLVQYMTPLWQPYRDTLNAVTKTFMALGQSQTEAHQNAVSHMFTTLVQQASIKAYADVFLYCAIAAFCVVPITFLFRASKAGGGGAPPAH